MYDSMCVPEMSYIDYSQLPEDRKPVVTPVPPTNTPVPNNNNFLHEGK